MKPVVQKSKCSITVTVYPKSIYTEAGLVPRLKKKGGAGAGSD